MKVKVKRGLIAEIFEDVNQYNIAEGTFIVSKGDTNTIFPLTKIDKVVVSGIPPQVPPKTPVEEPAQEITDDA